MQLLLTHSLIAQMTKPLIKHRLVSTSITAKSICVILSYSITDTVYYCVCPVYTQNLDIYIIQYIYTRPISVFRNSSPGPKQN